MKTTAWCVAGCILLLAAAAGRCADDARAAMQKEWTAQYFNIYGDPSTMMVKIERHDYATEKYGHAWDFEDGTRGRLAWASPGIENLRVEGGKLKFTTSAPKVTLAWGDTGRSRNSATEEWFALPGGERSGNVEIRARQSKDASTWFVTTWLGTAETAIPYRRAAGEQALKGTDWKTLAHEIKIPGDGLTLDIEGPVGNAIEIDAVSVFSTRYRGYYRKSFDVPAGAVWKAVLNINRPGVDAELYVNGVSRYRVEQDGLWNPWNATAFNPFPLEITAQVRPGRNTLAIYAERWNFPPAFLVQGTVAMASGERVRIETDKTWAWSPDPEPGWNQPSFDDAKWKRITHLRAPFFYYFKDTDRPYYDGLFRVANPDRKKLFYRDDRDVVFHAEIPAIFAARALPVTCVVDRLTGETRDAVATVSAGRGQVRGEALRYVLNAGRLPQGVYRATFAAGEAGARAGVLPRSEEFAVVGPTGQPVVAGTDWEEGLDVAAEETVNCADPADPHAFFDADGKTGSRIVERNGLKYRETESYDTYVAYAVKFQQPGAPYLVCVDYPDDRDRLINVSVLTAPGEKSLTWDICTPGVICGGGGKFPCSGKMKTLKFLYWAREPAASVRIENHGSLAFASRAAVARIRTFRINGGLPAVASDPAGERLFGVGTEWGDIIGGTFWTQQAERKQRFPDSQADWYPVLRRFTEYLRFSGQNFVNLGAFMYTAGRYYPDRRVDDSSLEKDFRYLLLEMFAANGLGMTAGVEYCYSAQLPGAYSASDREVAEEGRDTIWSVNKDGKQYRAEVSGGPMGSVNIFHPVAQKAILGVADELLAKFRDYPAFKGLTFHLFPGIYGPCIGMNAWRDGSLPITWGYDDAAVAAFEKDTGTRVPVDRKDPQRFGKRYDWLMANAKEPWVAWRCRAIFAFEKELLAHAKNARPDLIVANNLTMYPANLAPWLRSGLSLPAYLREMGYDPALYRATKDLYFNRWQFQLISHVAGGPAQQYLNWAWASDPDVIALFDREDSRGYCVQLPFDEHPIPETNPNDWPWKLKKFNAWGINWPAPGHEHFQQAFVQAFLDSDPDLVTFCLFDSNIPTGHEQEMREFATVFTGLPKARFRRLAGATFDPNAAVKEATTARGYHFVVVNPGWWEESVQVRLAGLPAGGRVLERIGGKPVPLSGGAFTVALKPYGMAAFTVPAGKARVAGATVTVDVAAVGGEFQGRIAAVQALLANPAAAALLDEAESAHVRSCLAAAAAAVARADFPAANAAVTDWKMNQFVATRLVKVASIIPWYAVGPFPNDREGKGFTTAFDPEKDVFAAGRPDTAKTYAGAAGLVRWRKIVSEDRDGVPFLNFAPLYQPNEWVTAYAFTTITSDRRQEVTLSFGSDDGAKVWVNGKEVISKYIARAAKPGDDTATIVLEKGVNPVLVKVEQQIGGWGFFFRLVGADGGPVTGLAIAP